MGAEVAAQRHVGIGPAPVLRDAVDEAAHVGDGGRFAARFAGGQENAAQYALAAADRRLHLDDFLDQGGMAGHFGHVPPVAQHDRQLRERRAQLMRRTRRQQPHAHDMLLLSRMLTQLRHIGFAILKVAIDPGHEQDQQHRDHHEADPCAHDVQVEQAAFQQLAKVERAIGEGQRARADRGDDDDAPGAPMMQQHRPQRHLHQIERDEGIGRPAAEVELRRQRDHVEQQRQEQLGMADIGAAAHDHQAADIHADGDAGHHQHRQDGQADAHAEMHDQDGGDLAGDGDPAQLDQQHHILAPGGIGRPAAGQPARAGRRGRGHVRRSGAVCRMTMM